MRFMTLLPSEVRTASPADVEADELGNPLNIGTFRGLELTIRASAFDGAAAFTVSIDSFDFSSNAWVQLLSSAPFQTTPESRTLTVLPDITEVTNLAASRAVPDRWRVTVDQSGGVSATYSIGAALLR